MPDDGLLVANIDFDGIKGSLEIKQSPASTSIERDKSLVTARQTPLSNARISNPTTRPPFLAQRERECLTRGRKKFGIVRKRRTIIIGRWKGRGSFKGEEVRKVV